MTGLGTASGMYDNYVNGQASAVVVMLSFFVVEFEDTVGLGQTWQQINGWVKMGGASM